MAISIWSFDDGYGDNKLYNGKDTIIIPSHCTKWKERMKNELDPSEVPPFSHYGVEVDGEKYLVGQGALEQTSSLNWSGGNNKHQDLHFPIIAKSCLAALTGKAPTVEVDTLMMGLPVRAEETKGRAEHLAELMVGHHEVRMTLADGREMEKKIKINEVVTKKQPFGSLCHLILDEGGGVTNKELASQFNVIVDIGTRTVNIYTIDSLEPIAELSDTRNHGIHVAYDYVKDFIEQELNVSIYSGTIANLIRKRKVKGIDLTPVIERSYELLANEIFKIVDTMFINAWVQVDNFIITGGGAELLKDALSNKFPVQPLFLNRTATSIGLWKYGVRHTIKKRGSITLSLSNGGSRKIEEIRV